ncbi:tetratricopeptide repeat protein [Rhodocytophaga aerolata]|uniref:Tetratricopeptide repeat protein n=1 Tax=Rhodocytophaga aerolata TaxID=455078 RepID=A0ABT8REH4_9BACT|nr:tetratricopeptide repeat protein [Rhodocytophaga aerolata]MDO1449125.1 tetratricopeptide repeat protein [Rhodocytophaga aerolata]
MKPHLSICYSIVCLVCILASVSCKKKNTAETNTAISELNLKRGEVITCGPPDREFGSLVFQTSCGDESENFNLALKLLHSFEYDEAEKVFASIIDRFPDCAMAYWGVAMSNFHPLWTPPTEAELKKGAKAIELAQTLSSKSKKEASYIAAIASFYKDWDTVEHRERCLRFEKAMEQVAADYPEDKEATIFYALALNAAADPSDKSFAKQKKAGAILQKMSPEESNHPGVIHYLIHTYDSPELATLALPAARKYASVAPSSAHALHMPSHIFTRLGLWEECIQSNRASVSSAQCYGEAAGIQGHWDEELHGLDYLMYAHLQKGENTLAKQQWDYLQTIQEVHPVNFKVAYAYAAIPARYVLENKRWQEAATLPMHPANFPWNEYPWQKAIIHFTRLLGAVHLENLASATTELNELNQIHQTLLKQKDAYKANQVLIQLKAGEAWIRFKEGKPAEALELMQLAADMEDKTEKHPVTPGEVIPARALEADLLMEMNQPAKALQAFEADFKKHPNRFNSLYSAGVAAQKAGNPEKATLYYKQLITHVTSPQTTRPEVKAVKQYLKMP